MSKFAVSVVADFGPSVITEQVRQALHKRQTDLKSSNPRSIVARESGLLHVVDVEVPGQPISRDEFMNWLLETARDHYGGPSFVVCVDTLPDDYVVEASPAVVEPIAPE